VEGGLTRLGYMYFDFGLYLLLILLLVNLSITKAQLQFVYPFNLHHLFSKIAFLDTLSISHHEIITCPLDGWMD
jgi:hypothetical protein